MSKQKISDETKFLLVIIALLLSVPLFFYLLSLNTGDEAPKKEAEKKPKELTVVVSETDKPAPAAPVAAQPVPQAVRDSIQQGDYSTAHLQITRMPKQSSQVKELIKAAVAANKGTRGPKQEPPTATTPLRYVDASSPRNRQADSFYLYLEDEGQAPRPWVCIQSFGPKPLVWNAVKVRTDGTSALLKITPSVARPGGKFAEYYDAPMNRDSYAVIKRLATARRSEVLFVGAAGTKEHKITEVEKKALARMLELYEALGGNVALFERK
ncbi:hypothetical protein [Geomesophilobacter sediminis]|uniref:Uncharacterized protein n=1 Tax=Geomesophilobacter sediminis TaxID=2798584 RepID=A0A8J7M0I8_9BACT|nr:hypothetical protein [Geomesophilobacter sediminis]MBJ6725412.1 hypothetical protein [Geomesophilobacter sediminis]